MVLDINTDAAVIFSNKLEMIRKSALPAVVKSTLNTVAFNVKKDSLPKSANNTFVNRSPNFFKANSRVEMAQGNRIDSMRSIVGMTSEGLNGEKNYAVKDLEQQEFGGNIKGRSFIPTNKARGGSNNKMVRPGNRMSQIKNKKIVDAMKGKGKNRHERFVKSAIHAGVGGYVIGNFAGILWKITSIRRRKLKLIGRGSNTVVKGQALYYFKKGRSVSVEKTEFMQTASLKSAKNMEKIFIGKAKRMIIKLTK